MATEKVVAQLVLEADESSFKEADGKLKVFARDTKKELDRNTLFQLRLDKANLQVQLEQVRTLLRQAKKEGDKEATLNLQIKSDTLRSQLTEAGRQLNNYQNTGDKSLSRLQAKFNETNKVIQAQGSIVSGLNTVLGTLGVSLGTDFSAQRSIVSGLNTALGTLGVSLGTYFSAQKVVEFSNAFTNLDNRLRQVAEGDSLNTLRDKIFEGANSARVGVEEYASAFVRFDLVNKQLGGSQQETLVIVDSLAKGLSASGAAASEVNAVMLQLAQAFGSGRLQGDEFRSVAENMPILLDILAEKLGVSRGELKNLASEGKITSEVLKSALIDSNELLNDSFDKTSVTIGQAMTNATNKFIKKFGEMDQTYNITLKVTTAIGKLSDLLIAGVGFVFKYMDAIKQLITALIILKSAQALLGVATILRGLPAIFGTATLGANLFATANTILAGTLARLGIASTAALGPLSVLVGAIYAAIYAYRELKEAQSNRSSGQINAQNVRGQVADTATDTAREIQKIKAENDKLAKQNTTQAREQIKLNENNLKIEQQKLKTQNLILQSQTLVTQGKIDEADLLQSSITKEQQKLQSLRNEFGLEKRVADLKSTDVSLKIDSPDFSNLGGGGGTPKKSTEIEDLEKLLKEEQKLKEEAEKEEYERLQRRKKWLEDQEEAKQKKLEETAKKVDELYKEGSEIFAEGIEASKKKIDELQKEITSVLDEIKKIDEELAGLDKKRATTLGERNVEIEKELAKLREEGSQDVLRINELLEEQRLIRENASSDELKEAARRDALSPTEKFLEDLALEKKLLEEKKILKEQELADLELQKVGELAVLENYTLEKQALDERYKTYIAGIEEQITSKLREETDKRIEALKKVEAQAIATANALRNVSTGTGSKTTASSSTTNNNTVSPTVIVNATMSSNMDVQNIGNQLADIVTLSSKGIK